MDGEALARDRPAVGSAALADEASSARAPGAWDHLRWCMHVARVSTALYEGDGASAYIETETARAALDASRLLRTAALRVETVYLRGVAAIAVPALDVAAHAVKVLAAEKGRLGWVLGHALAGALAAARGEVTAAAARFEEAEHGAAILDLDLYVAAARRRRAELVGGDEGLALFETAEAWMHDRRHRAPGPHAAMLMAERR